MPRPPRFNPLYLLPLVAPFVLLAPVLLTGQAMFWGTPFLQFVPWRWTAWEMLRAGHLPLWNPWVGMGAPLAANYQSALFYPPNGLLFLLAALGGVGWLAWGQGLLVALHLSWAALGTVLLARRSGLGPLAQAVSGLAFGLSGFLVARSGFLSINSAVAWTPWVLLLVHRLTGPPARRPAGTDVGLQPTDLLKCSAVLAMQLLAGHAQIAWYTLLLAGLWAGYRGWSRAGRRDRLSAGKESWAAGKMKGVLFAWTKLGLALVLAVALAAVQLLPTAEFLLQSQRSASVEYSFAMTYSFWPWRFLTLLAPNLFGSPVQGDYWGYGNYWEDAVYVGILPLLLSLGAVAFAWRRASPRKKAGNQVTSDRSRRGADIRFWTAILLISFTLALGQHTPVFPWLYRYLPTFDMFQGPARFTLWAELALALLAGYGVDRWRRPAGSRLYWTRLGTAGAFAVSIGAGLAWLLLKDINPTFLPATALAGFWGIGTGILALLAPIQEDLANPPGWHAMKKHRLKPRLQPIVEVLMEETGWKFPGKHESNWSRGFSRLVPLELFKSVRLEPRLQPIVEIPAEEAGSQLLWKKEPSTSRSRGFSRTCLSISNWTNRLKPRLQPFLRSVQLTDRLQSIRGKGNQLDIWNWAVLLFLTVDLLVAGWGLNPGTSPSLYLTSGPAAEKVRALAGDRRLYLPDEDEYSLKFDRFFQFKSFNLNADWLALRSTFLPNAALYDGLRTANNFDPLVPGRFAGWMEALRKAGPAVQARLLNQMGVGVVEKKDGSNQSGVHFESNPAGRRLRWVSCAHRAEGPSDSLQLVLEGQVDLEREVIVEGIERESDRLCPAGAEVGSLSGTLEIRAEAPDSLQIHVRSGSPGWLVLSDVWYPGWQAWVDGEAAPVWRANYLFRAVAVPSGEHEVRFVYRPLSFLLGAIISLAAWGKIIACGMRALRLQNRYAGRQEQ